VSAGEARGRLVYDLADGRWDVLCNHNCSSLQPDRIIRTAAANRYRLIMPFERPASTAQDALAGSWDVVLDEG
jgi:hypothetical protein